MVHRAIDLIRYATQATCDFHGRESPACSAAKELSTVASFGLAGGAIGGAAAGKKGAAVGTFVGMIAGVVINNAAERIPTIRATR